MEAGLILDDHMQGRRVALADLLQKERMHVLVDAGSKQQLQLVGSVHLHRLMEVAPLAAGRIGAWTRTPRRPQTRRITGSNP
jgi:hypothetical protein